MHPDLLRLGLVVTLSGVIGLLVGNVFAGLAAGCLICLVWQYRMLRYISGILRTGAAPRPHAAAVVSEITDAIDSLRARHKQREEELVGSLAHLKEATEALPDAVVVMDVDGHVEWANEKASAYLGIRFPRDRRQRLSHIIRQPELLDCLADADKAVPPGSFIVSSPVNDALSLEIRVLRYARYSLLLVARNVTDIQRANRMRRDFIANASHELRTPLTVISGYLEAIESEIGELLPEWQPRIEKMQGQTRRMQNLIEDLLKLSGLESEPHADLDNEVDMAETLALIHAEAQTLSGDQNHIFTLEIQAGLVVKGNRSSLYSAYSNIVFNAVQYTPAGGVIEIKWYRTGTGACLEVADTGEGIPAEHIQRVTERFYRVDKGRSREKGGTGLGLAIVKHVMAQHEAELKISSELGTGTTVACHFPGRRVCLVDRMP